MQHLINTDRSLVNGLNGLLWLADSEAQVHSHHLAGSEALKTWSVGATTVYTLVAVLGLLWHQWPSAEPLYWHNNIERDQTQLLSRTPAPNHDITVTQSSAYSTFTPTFIDFHHNPYHKSDKINIYDAHLGLPLSLKYPFSMYQFLIHTESW